VLPVVVELVNCFVNVISCGDAEIPPSQRITDALIVDPIAQPDVVVFLGGDGNGEE